MGFGGSDFKTGGVVKGKLGLFTGAISGGAGDVGSIPALKSPTTLSNKTNPSITIIVDQLESLVKTAKKMGVITQEQQKLMLKDISETRKADKEALIETKDNGATIQNAGISPEMLAPLSSIIEQLVEKLGVLDKTLDDKLNDQDNLGGGTFASRFFDSLGFGDEYGAYDRRRSARRTRLASPENQRRARIEERNRRASKFDPELLKSKKGKPLTGDALTQHMNKLDRVGGSGSIFSRFRSSIAGATQVARGGAGSVRSSLKRIAGPLISRTLGRTVLKSIPIIGIAAGLGFAVSRLVKGDVVGAGLEATSGLAGPVTAIPAMVASIARDSYADVYGVQPEQDPEAPKRVVELKAATEDLIKETISGQVEKKEKPSKSELDKAFIGDNQKTTPSKVTSESKQPPVPTPVIPKPAASGSAAGAGSSASGSAKPVSITKSGAAPSSQPKQSESESVPILNTSADLKSTELTKQTLDVKRMEDFDKDEVFAIPASKGPIMPSSLPTTRPGAAGIGDVRSPYYDFNQMGSIPNQVYY